jgi:hypothetical protein
MTDITNRLLSMSEAMYMDRDQDELDALLLEAKGEIERLRATKPLATNISEVSRLCRSVAEQMIEAGIQWRLDPRYIIKLCDAADHVGALELALKPFATIAQVENSIGTRVGASVIVNVERCRDALAALIPQQKGNADGK